MIKLHHALTQLRIPSPTGEMPVFSLDFVVATGENKGKIYHIERCVVHYVTKLKGKGVVGVSEGGHKTYTRQGKGRYSRKSSDCITLKVLQSDDVKHPIINPKIILITRINGLKTYL